MSTITRDGSSGSDTLIQRARPAIVLITISKHAPACAVVFLPPAIWAGVEGSWDLAAWMLLAATLSMLGWIASYGRALPRDLRKVEAMVSVALLFALVPVLAVPSFMTLGMPPVDALFEGMSAITTTGLSVARDPDSWPFSAHVLRSWMQWCGGLAMATAVLALLVSPGLPARKLGDAGMDSDDRIASTRTQARQLLGVYFGLTLVLSALTALVIPDAKEALVLTLSAISTGGFAPRSDSLASYSLLGQSMVILSCTVGAVSLLFYVYLLRGRVGEAWRLGAAQRMLRALLFLGASALVLQLPWGGAISADAFLDLVSGATTAGFSTGPMPTGGPFLILLLIAMVMGGDVGSTGGGIKLMRVGLLLRGVRHSLSTARLPDRAVAPLRRRGRPVSDAVLISLLALLVLYFGTMLAVWSLFLAHGHPGLPALFDTISTLSTVGLSTGIVGADLSPDLKLALTLAMWLGRLEFIAVLVLVLPRTWFRKR
ncbi:TrkH family potassium uptake protein [Dinoroseobacter sp. S375]|uniref:TrkH family potassium uptake protein n=1 Tax=Dinoroseobacter sp. S375 TaxID=3415136 RepID=UPI003C7DACEC